MKNYKGFFTVLILVIVAMLLAAPAMADRYFTDTGGTLKGIALPADNNAQTVMNAFSFDAALATADVTWYVGDATSTTFLNAEAASQTALTITSCTGIDDNDYVALYSPSGDVMEFNQVSACNDTTNVATVTALRAALPTASVLYELKLKATFTDVGTTALHWSNDQGLLAAPRGKPLGARITGGVIWYGTAVLR